MKAKPPWLIQRKARKAKALLAELHLAQQAAEHDPIGYLLDHRPVQVIRDELVAMQESLSPKKP